MTTLTQASPTGFHRHISVELSLMLRTFCPDGYIPAIGMAIEVAPGTIVSSDVVVLRKSFGLRSPTPIAGALLMVEVVPPTWHFHEVLAKTERLAAAGMTSLWVVDPTCPRGVELTEYRIGSKGTYEEIVSTNQVFTTETPYPVMVDVRALTVLREVYRKAQAEA